MNDLLFNSWESLLRTVIMTICSYAGLVVMLRWAKNRTLSQLNAFDFVVTIALGSVLATVMLNKNLALADGLLALGLLIFLQFVVNTMSTRSRKLRDVIKTPPTLIFYKGEFLEKPMKRNRISKDEVLQIVRSKGIGNVQKVDAIVFESNGKFSVIQQIDTDDDSVLQNVSRNP